MSTMTSTPEYALVVERFRPHIKAATLQKYAELSGGKMPSMARLDHIVDIVLKKMALEIERANDLKVKPDLAIVTIIASIKATIEEEFKAEKP